MKRLFTIAAIVFSFSFVATNSEANGRYYGGRGFHHGSHGTQGYGYAPQSRSHSNQGYGNYYGGQSSYGHGGYGYQSHYNQSQYNRGYQPSYQSYGRQQGGLQFDVGRHHFGSGRHH